MIHYAPGRANHDFRIIFEQLQLAPIRWESADVSVERISEAPGQSLEDELAAELDAAMDTIHRRIETTLGRTRAVGCRLWLTGRSKSHQKLRHYLSAGNVLAQRRLKGDVVYFVEKVIDEAAPALDLEHLARAGDPPGLLARRILALQQGGSQAERIVEAGKEAMSEATRFAGGALVDDGSNDLDAERARELLVRAGMQALEELLAQQAGFDGSQA